MSEAGHNFPVYWPNPTNGASLCTGDIFFGASPARNALYGLWKTDVRVDGSAF